MSRKPYATDLTDAQWERLEPLIPKPKSGTRKGGRPATVDRREILNAVFYHLRAGGSWELLPHDLPHHKTVFHYFTLWRRNGVWEQVHARLREDVRVEAGYPPQPATGRLDSQTVKTTRTPGDRGYDGGKQLTGRKRFVLVDSLGLIWALWVTTANQMDRDGGRWLLSQCRHLLPRVREVVVDNGFNGKFVTWTRRVCGWAVQTMKTLTGSGGKGFQVHARRWVVERTFGWLVSYRRLGKDYERHTETSEAMIHAAMIHLMIRRLPRFA